jgi:hypothetical protein
VATQIFTASIAGLVAGGAVAFATTRWLLGRFAGLSSRPALVHRVAWAGCVSLLLPAAFVAFVVGGNIGGALGARSLAHIESVGIAVGIFAGVGLVLAVLLIAGALLGALAGLVCGKVHRARTAT